MLENTEDTFAILIEEILISWQVHFHNGQSGEGCHVQGAIENSESVSKTLRACCSNMLGVLVHM